jgi:hypothetical protein
LPAFLLVAGAALGDVDLIGGGENGLHFALPAR